MDIRKTIDAAQNGKWLDYKGAQILVRTSPAIVAAIRKQCLSDGILNEEKLEIALAESMIVDWKGLTDNGAEFKCTDENKRLLLDSSFSFRRFINESIIGIEDIGEAELKN